MFFPKALLLGASLYSYALAQTKIAFTHVPAVVVAGESYNITWGGGDDTPVTITLREGDPDDLKTVQTLADGISEDFFVWTVQKDLKTANDYALQITQGQNDINYSGQFSLTSSTASTTASASGNSTASITSTNSGASQGTGSAIPRNTTFSSATISRTASLPSTTTETSSGSVTFGDMTSTSSSSPTAAATTSAPDSNAAGVAQLGSSAAMVMGIFAAVVCLS
ncbi:uncharacterized protein PV06_00989 [Exophiala oligosperma]|uniref:Yeast cell wall synthesis Kre9/Knh1-like N-terminal domain-containing protein n=2 Tax=Chaetothyriales TaxID=34395 RepID=A0A0D2B855_9EURO|nr:uncharacterized protein PV06_00989 [Exophiala oligosperma]KAJ9633296.1 hypothetical protein H2204_007192 [Knufia peltigerae]KIW48401.1 hypothetical protein PV06_00989 [Exophiala oligosperma]